MAVRGNRVLHRRGDVTIFLEEPSREHHFGNHWVGHPDLPLSITTPILGQLDCFSDIWTGRIRGNGHSRILGDCALIFIGMT